MKSAYSHYQHRAFRVFLPLDYGQTVTHVPVDAELFSLNTRQRKFVWEFLEGEEALGVFQVGFPDGPLLDAVLTCVEP